MKRKIPVIAWFLAFSAAVLIFYTVFTQIPPLYVAVFGGNGEIINVLPADTGGRKLLVIEEDLSRDYYTPEGGLSLSMVKLYTVDIATGGIIAATGDQAGTTCLGVSGNLLWCHNRKRGIHGRSADTLEITVTVPDIEKANPALNGAIGSNFNSFQFDSNDHTLLITTVDGYRHAVDGATLKARPYEKTPPPGKGILSIIDTRIILPDRSALQLNGYQRFKLLGNAVTHDISFLNGSFLYEMKEWKPITAGDPTAYYVVHFEKQTDNGDHAGLTLTAITGEGARLWDLPLYLPSEKEDAGRFPKGALVDGESIVIVLESPSGSRIIRLKAASGQIEYDREL